MYEPSKKVLRARRNFYWFTALLIALNAALAFFFVLRGRWLDVCANSTAAVFILSFGLYTWSKWKKNDRTRTY